MAQLVQRISLDGEATRDIIELAASGLNETNVESTVLFMMTICQSQSESVEFPPSAAEQLVVIGSQMQDALIKTGQEYEADGILRPIILAVVQLINLDNADPMASNASELLEALIREAKLSPTLAASACEAILAQYLSQNGAQTEDEERKEAILGMLTNLFRRLHNKFPKEIDALVEHQLNTLGKTRRHIVYNLVSSTFKGTIHEPIQNLKTTLYLSLQHPEASIRRIAVDRLAAIVAEDKSVPDFAEDVLLDRLKDDDHKVVQTVLRMEALPDVVAGPSLVSALHQILHNDDSSLENKCAAFALLLKVLGREGAVMDDAVKEDILSAFFWSNHTRKLTKAAISASAQPDFPFRHLVVGCEKTLPVPKTSKEKGELSAETLAVAMAEVVGTIAGENFFNELAVDQLSLIFGCVGNLLKSPQRDADLQFFIRSLSSSSYSMRLLALLVLSLAFVQADGASKYVIGAALLDNVVKHMSQLDAPMVKDNAEVLSTNGQVHPALMKELIATRVSKASGPESKALVFALNNLISYAKPPEGSFAWMLDVSKETEAAGYKALITNVFRNFVTMGMPSWSEDLLKSLFKHHVGKETIEFCSVFWTDDDVDSTPSVKTAALNIATSFVRLFAEPTTPLKYDFQLVVPTLMVALANQSKVVRNSALVCLTAIKACYARFGVGFKKQKAGSIYAYDLYYGPSSGQVQYLTGEAAAAFVTGLLACKDEMLTDELFLERHVHTLLLKSGSNDPEVYRDDVLSFLVTNILASPKTYMQSKLLATLRLCDSPAKLKSLYPVLESTLKLVVSDTAEDGKTHEHRCQLLVLLIQSFTARAVSALFGMRSGRYVKIFREMILLDRALKVGSRAQSIQQVVTGQISADWFKAIAVEKQSEVFGALVDLTVNAPQSTVDTVKRLFRKLPLTAELVLAQLEACQNDLVEAVEPAAKKLRGSGEEKLQVFFRLTSLLELLEYKKDIENKTNLIGFLFELLGTIINLEASGAPVSLQYIKQLILGATLSLVEFAKKTNTHFDDSSLRVDLLVQCIRVTDNPQTHNAALLLMAAIATVYPDKVLPEIISVFTFMGASVVRQDDNYSSHVIQQTLETILPPLVAKHKASASDRTELVAAVKPVLEPFVNAAFLIPKHRCQRLFTVLITTLGDDTFLDVVIMLILAKYTTKSSRKSASGDTIETIEDLFEFGLSLCQQFSGLTQLNAICGILKTIGSLPDEKPEDEDEDSGEGLFDIRAHLQKELRHFKHLCAKFVGTLLGSRTFAARFAAIPEEDSEARVTRLTEMLLALLSTANTYLAEKEEEGSPTDVKYAKALSGTLYETLGRATAPLSLPAFLRVIAKLFRNDDITIRRKSIDMLTKKVEDLGEDIDDDAVAAFKRTVNDLKSFLAKDDGSDADIKVVENKQAALICLTTMARAMGQQDVDTYASVASVLVKDGVLKHSNKQVVASAFVGLTAICIEIGPRILPVLPKFMPAIIGNIKEELVESEANKESVLLAALASLDAIVETLPQFVSPYISTIVELTLHPSLQRLPDATGAVTRVVEKSNDLLSALAQKVAARVVLPAIFDQLKTALANGKASLLGLFGLVGNVITHMPKADLVQHHKELFRFFLVSFDYRRTNGGKVSAEDLNLVENSIISSFLQLVMKMNETLFKPLFLRTIDWATSELLEKNGLSQADIDARQIFFYRLLDNLLGRLKSIIAPYYGYVFETSINRLDGFKKRKTPVVLWTSVVSSLQKWFLYDNDGAVSDDRFEKLLAPLVSQIAAVDVHGKKYMDRMTTSLIPCLGQLAVAGGNEVRWKPLNQQILMQTRSERPEIRLTALKVLQELYDRLGEEMLVLFPETIPFLAELMEDDDAEVEKACRDLCAKIQQYLGEPIEQYFTA
ncbi:HEAT repeat-containing protein 1 [Rhizophlyctis rosea]|nr:HEAT repeat-containing protein 1 [Rhizophlyctis rosea]